MSGFIGAAEAILSSAERRLESAARNVANMPTSGYKREIDFAELVTGPDGAALPDVVADGAALPRTGLANDFTQGRLAFTGGPLDLAIAGPGLLAVRAGEDVVFSRGGAFALAEGGVLADAEGRVLQQAGGGDLLVSGNAIEILADGTVLEDGLPVGALALVDPVDPANLRAIGGSLFAADAADLAEDGRSQLRQGFLEQSNVVLSDEMATMMASVRQAEGGARIVQFYNQMIGQAVETFRGGGR